MAVIHSLRRDDLVSSEFNCKDSCEKYLLVRNVDQGKSTRYFWVTGQSITRFRTSARSRIDDHGCP